MHILLSKTDDDSFFSDDFEDDNGDRFSLAVEIGTNPGGMEEIMIQDSIGRHVPILVEDLPDLIKAFGIILTGLQQIQQADDVTDLFNSLESHTLS